MKPTFPIKYILRFIILASIVLILTVVISLKFFAFDNHLIAKKIACKLFDKHIVKVETDNYIEPNYVSIKMISSKGEEYIYRNGKKINRIDYLHGDYAFKIYYKDTLLKVVGYFNNRWYNNNNYFFHIHKNNDILSATFKVVGPDSISHLYWGEIFQASTIDSLTIKDNNIFNPSENGSSPRNVIDLTLEAKDYRIIEDNFNAKNSFNNAKISINNNPAEIKKIKIIGASSLSYRRKGYKISLKEPCLVYYKGSSVQIENFRLVSLSMDPYYFHMFISYGLMKEIGLFDLYFSYAEVIINKETQGIYLLIEDPDFYALKRKESSFIIRRDYRYSNSILVNTTKNFDFKCNHKNNSLTDDQYLQSFKSIYSCLYKFNNKDLFESLSKQLNLNKYMQWMAMNYFLCNSDYTDEIFFFSNTINNSTYFDIIPWDYDDILSIPPHEGWDHRHVKIGNKLIYSVEDSLDLKIAVDEYLYSKYLSNLTYLMKTIDDDRIKRIFNEANDELIPFLQRNEIIAMSRYDKTKFKSYDEFNIHLKASYLFLIERRKIIYNRLLQNGTVTDSSFHNLNTFSSNTSKTDFQQVGK